VIGSIIQTAITNKTLRLELDYRQPSVRHEGDTNIEERMIDTGVVPLYDDPQVSDEFACMLRMICEGSGEFS